MATHHFKFKLLYFQKINSTTKLDDLNTNRFFFVFCFFFCSNCPLGFSM